MYNSPPPCCTISKDIKLIADAAADSRNNNFSVIIMVLFKQDFIMNREL